MRNTNITKPLQLTTLLIAFVFGILGKYDVAIWILLMGIYGDKIDRK
jgi:hypothetical protein